MDNFRIKVAEILKLPQKNVVVDRIVKLHEEIVKQESKQ